MPSPRACPSARGERLSGFAAGEQRSPATGGGIEFADYREYVPGDDVRLLDWSVYLRSRKLLVKLCAEEKELTLVAIVDMSRSMDFGSPTKLELAKRIASVLAGIALRGGNRAGVAALGASLLEPMRPERRKLTMAGIAASRPFPGVRAAIGPGGLPSAIRRALRTQMRRRPRHGPPLPRMAALARRPRLLGLRGPRRPGPRSGGARADRPGRGDPGRHGGRLRDA